MVANDDGRWRGATGDFANAAPPGLLVLEGEPMRSIERVDVVGEVTALLRRHQCPLAPHLLLVRSCRSRCYRHWDPL